MCAITCIDNWADNTKIPHGQSFLVIECSDHHLLKVELVKVVNNSQTPDESCDSDECGSLKIPEL